LSIINNCSSVQYYIISILIGQIRSFLTFHELYTHGIWRLFHLPPSEILNWFWIICFWTRYFKTKIWMLTWKTYLLCIFQHRMLIILPSKHTLTSFLMRFLLAFQYSSKTTCDVGMTRMFHHIWLFQDHLNKKILECFSYHKLRSAWLSFLKLLDIDFENGFSCPDCPGDGPEIIILLRVKFEYKGPVHV
jgi:hypothetical protein